MNKEEALAQVKKLLPEKRYIHTLGVVESASELSIRYGADKEKAEMAAILHDIAKYFPVEQLREYIETHDEIPSGMLLYHPSLWHAPVGAVYVKEQFGINDQDVLDAITYHTTGRTGMTLLEKIVFLADYIEPGRAFPGVDEVREMAKASLDLAVAKALANTTLFLVENYKQVYPDTLAAYNDLIKDNGKRITDWKKERGNGFEHK
ncbi:MAG: bis(5'-nucleosyl)-tetraphosphatase (symmetrical) YqeK [Tuberibacillus sp.]